MAWSFSASVTKTLSLAQRWTGHTDILGSAWWAAGHKQHAAAMGRPRR